MLLSFELELMNDIGHYCYCTIARGLVLLKKQLYLKDF